MILGTAALHEPGAGARQGRRTSARTSGPSAACCSRCSRASGCSRVKTSARRSRRSSWRSPRSTRRQRTCVCSLRAAWRRTQGSGCATSGISGCSSIDSHSRRRCLRDRGGRRGSGRQLLHCCWRQPPASHISPAPASGTRPAEPAVSDSAAREYAGADVHALARRNTVSVHRCRRWSQPAVGASDGRARRARTCRHRRRDVSVLVARRPVARVLRRGEAEEDRDCGRSAADAVRRVERPWRRVES